jgi:hypothetical protein
VLLDLFNREIIGFSTGSQKNKELITRAFASVHRDLRQIQMFHTEKQNLCIPMTFDSPEQLVIEF